MPRIVRMALAKEFPALHPLVSTQRNQASPRMHLCRDLNLGQKTRIFGIESTIGEKCREVIQLEDSSQVSTDHQSFRIGSQL